MATRGSSRPGERSNTRKANANANATKKASTTTAANQQPRTASRQNQQSPSQPSPSQPSQSQPSQISNTSNASPPRGGDQQRELRTTQELGGARPSPSPRRADLDQGSDVFSQLNSLAAASPFAVMRRMMEDMDRLFSPLGTTQSPRGQQGLQRGGQRALQPLSRGLWAPQVEVFERGNNLVVRAELPGLSREDVDVEVDDDVLVIRGERHNDVEDEHDGYYRSERSYGSFYRAIPLPEGVDASSCNANFKDGVLEVTLPKPTPQVSRAKKVNVR